MEKEDDFGGLLDPAEQDAYDNLSDEVKKVNESALVRLFVATVKRLIARIEAGTAKTGDIANAIRILQDNGIKMDFGEFSGEEEEEAEVNEILESLKELDADL